MAIDYQRLYEYRFRAVDQAARRAVWAEIAQYIYSRMGEPSALIDVAAGRGEFITAVPARERWVVDVADHGSLGDTDIKLIVGDVLDADLPADYFDGAFISNFLEHLPSQESIGVLLKKVHASMRGGGVIAILGPNFRYCAREYFDCADHTVPLTHVAVDEHLNAAGFEVTDVVPRFLPYSFRGLLPPSAKLTRAYLKIRPLWNLLGKQFLVLARRP